MAYLKRPLSAMPEKAREFVKIEMYMQLTRHTTSSWLIDSRSACRGREGCC